MVCVPHWWTTFINMHSSTFKLSLFFFLLLFAFFCLTHCSRAGNRNLISSRTSQSKREDGCSCCLQRPECREGDTHRHWPRACCWRILESAPLEQSEKNKGIL